MPVDCTVGKLDKICWQVTWTGYPVKKCTYKTVEMTFINITISKSLH